MDSAGKKIHYVAWKYKPQTLSSNRNPELLTEHYLRVNSKPITCVCVSNNNEWIFAGGKDGSIIQYDLKTRRKIWTYWKSEGHKSHVLDIAVSPSNKYLVSSKHLVLIQYTNLLVKEQGMLLRLFHAHAVLSFI